MKIGLIVVVVLVSVLAAMPQAVPTLESAWEIQRPAGEENGELARDPWIDEPEPLAPGQDRWFDYFDALAASPWVSEPEPLAPGQDRWFDYFDALAGSPWINEPKPLTPGHDQLWNDHLQPVAGVPWTDNRAALAVLGDGTNI